MEGKIKVLGRNQNSEQIEHVYLIFCAFGYFYCDVFKMGCTKIQSPRIGTVLQWRPPNVHIFGTDPFTLLIRGLPSLLSSNRNLYSLYCLLYSNLQVYIIITMVFDISHKIFF